MWIVNMSFLHGAITFTTTGTPTTVAKISSRPHPTALLWGIYFSSFSSAWFPLSKPAPAHPVHSWISFHVRNPPRRGCVFFTSTGTVRCIGFCTGPTLSQHPILVDRNVQSVSRIHPVLPGYLLESASHGLLPPCSAWVINDINSHDCQITNL